MNLTETPDNVTWPDTVYCFVEKIGPFQETAMAVCETFKGGKYARFVLTGSYSNLGAASGRVFERVKELDLKRRDDFCIESYVNDPKTTPESELVTEILIPIE